MSPQPSWIAGTEGPDQAARRQVSGLVPPCLSQTLCTKATMQAVRAADTNEVVKLILRESDNDRKVSMEGGGMRPGEGPALTAPLPWPRPGKGPHLLSCPSAPSDLAWGGGPPKEGPSALSAPSVAPPWGGAPCSDAPPPTGDAPAGEEAL